MWCVIWWDEACSGNRLQLESLMATGQWPGCYWLIRHVKFKELNDVIYRCNIGVTGEKSLQLRPSVKNVVKCVVICLSVLVRTEEVACNDRNTEWCSNESNLMSSPAWRCNLNYVNCYALVVANGHAPRALSNHVVCLSVCLSVSTDSLVYIVNETDDVITRSTRLKNSQVQRSRSSSDSRRNHVNMTVAKLLNAFEPELTQVFTVY